MSGRPERVLIIHDESDKYLDAMIDRFSAVEFRLCADAGGAEGARAFEPRVVFSWKCGSIPAPLQRSIASGPSVEWVHVAGAGFEHLLPLPGHIRVTNSSGVFSAFMAETVMAAILMWNFGFPRYMEQQRRKLWRQSPWQPLSLKTVLIIGLGSIGAAVAQRAKSFGMRVIGVRRSPQPVDNVEEVLATANLRDALPLADYVCLHIPLTKLTRSLLGSEEFKRMKNSAVLINTSRGGVVKESALIEALNNGGIAGAYFDVFETEPLPRDSAMWTLPNLIISPHVSDSVADWEKRSAEFFATNLDRWLRKKPLLNNVDPDEGY